ncbi:DUF7555 family protein [Halomicrobium urmianum]|uniref:DUF7555 family protein n=1 Tax=Halomicrobium urmianum TaxID=1586233 RepID=UPI001CD918D0|nr:hypothetical protein [Halomicrobium urmianum]
MDDRAGAALDAAVYAVAVTAVATLLGGAAALLAGGGWIPVKVTLFVVGFALFGYASISMWRALSPDPDEGVSARGYREPTPFESALARAVPAAGGLVPPDDRLSPSVKLFVASLLVLGVSLAMETVFGVR